MTENDEVMTQQNADARKAVRTKLDAKFRTGRRRFLWQALAATSGIALSELLPSLRVRAAAQGCTPGPALVKVGEITRNRDRLQAIIKMVNGNRTVPTSTGSTRMMLRYFHGVNPRNPREQWPTSNAAGPGPTLRCEVGDTMEITLLNQVNVADFQGTLFSGEEGSPTGCDEVTKVIPGSPSDTNWYPSNDKYPNCFHASSAVNIHFHGTHVTPSTTGDNILVNVQPDTNMTPNDERMIHEWFQKEIFDKGVAVKNWNSLPKDWRDYQMGPWKEPWKRGRKDRNQNFDKGLVGVYDATAPYQGGHGLPDKLKLWPQNETVINTPGEWPQYYVGSYPICFPIPKHNPAVKHMGQAPGTHWYHAHKHGSTSINLFNGIAGALIIEDNSPTGYDGALKHYYEKHRQKLEQDVLVFQQLTDTINLMVGGNPKEPPVCVNGQLTPTITMRQGEIRLWRMINATVSGFIGNGQFQSCSGGATLQCRQTAQDGIQFAKKNYTKQPLGNTGAKPMSFPMAPANRVDLLVQAPTTPGLHVLNATITPGGGGSPAPLLFVNVTKENAIDPSMQFPPEDDFPDIPSFLKDITKDDVDDRTKEIRYGSVTPTTGRKLTQWEINEKQFTDGDVDERMQLNTAEEWTIKNLAGPKHPFHIHINPFQIIETYDATTDKKTVLEPPFIWWDTFAIPQSKKNGDQVTPGYFKMRSKFVDFTGLYVEHCHILAHEDRGMMQLVEVCEDINKCPKHINLHHH